MKVLISWSGELSHRVALELRKQLPLFIQAVEPWVSSEDIAKGELWHTELAKELEDGSVGILCITRENVGSPWVNYEAGDLRTYGAQLLTCRGPSSSAAATRTRRSFASCSSRSIRRRHHHAPQKRSSTRRLRRCGPTLLLCLTP